MSDAVRPSPPVPESDNDWWRAAERRALRTHRLRLLGQRVAGALRRVGRGLAGGARLLLPPWVVATVVVLLIGGAAVSVVRDLDFGYSSDTTDPGHVHPSGEYATSSPGAVAAGPFDGTPAADYAEGSAGIMLPAAKPTAGISRKQVDAALSKVRKALIAGRLDRRMLAKHDTSAFLALFPRDLRRELVGDFRSAQFSSFATWIDPSAELMPIKPRVSGRTTYRAATWGGRRGIDVVTNYVWVYAFTEGGAHPGGHLAVVHDEVTWFLPVPGPREAAPELRIRATQSYAYGMDCKALKKGLLAPSNPNDPGPAEPNPEDPDSYYNPDRSLKVGDTCDKHGA